MCLTKSPRKISGLHFRTCHSICFAVGDSMGKTPSNSGCHRIHTAYVGAAAASARRDGRRVLDLPGEQRPTFKENFGFPEAVYSAMFCWSRIAAYIGLHDCDAFLGGNKALLASLTISDAICELRANPADDGDFKLWLLWLEGRDRQDLLTSCVWERAGDRICSDKISNPHICRK